MQSLHSLCRTTSDEFRPSLSEKTAHPRAHGFARRSWSLSLFYFVFLLTVALIARSYTRTCKRTLMCLFCTIYQHFLRLFSMRWNVIKRFTRVTSGVGGLSCHLLITSTPYVTTCVSLPSPPVHIWEMNGVGWAAEKKYIYKKAVYQKEMFMNSVRMMYIPL